MGSGDKTTSVFDFASDGSPTHLHHMTDITYMGERAVSTSHCINTDVSMNIIEVLMKHKYMQNSLTKAFTTLSHYFFYCEAQSLC